MKLTKMHIYAPRGLLAWVAPLSRLRLFWRAVGAHTKAPLISFFRESKLTCYPDHVKRNIQNNSIVYVEKQP